MTPEAIIDEERQGTADALFATVGDGPLSDEALATLAALLLDSVEAEMEIAKPVKESGNEL